MKREECREEKREERRKKRGERREKKGMSVKATQFIILAPQSFPFSRSARTAHLRPNWKKGSEVRDGAKEKGVAKIRTIRAPNVYLSLSL